MARTQVKFQLYDADSAAISGSGGVVYVAAANDAAKQAITDKDGVSLTNPRALTAGGCEFYVPSTVTEVDLYIMAPDGQFVVKTGVKPGTLQDVRVDTANRNQLAIIPFAIGDTTAAAETDTGFNMPLYSAVLPAAMVRVLTVDATETIDVGLLSSETAGDANGFVSAIALDTAGLVKATVTNGSATAGALLFVQDSANAGDEAPEPHVITGSNAVSVTYTLTAGTDTAEGFIILPYVLTT